MPEKKRRKSEENGVKEETFLKNQTIRYLQSAGKQIKSPCRPMIRRRKFKAADAASIEEGTVCTGLRDIPRPVIFFGSGRKDLMLDMTANKIKRNLILLMGKNVKCFDREGRIEILVMTKRKKWRRERDFYPKHQIFLLFYLKSNSNKARSGGSTLRHLTPYSAILSGFLYQDRITPL